jgi:atypical dual specificity phosphatase
MASDYWFYSVGPVVRSSPQPRHAVILPQLIVGEYLRPDDTDWLKNTMGVASVLCLQDHVDFAGKALLLADLIKAYRTADIHFDHAPVPDGDQQIFCERLPAILAQLDAQIAARRTVYVHCNAGMNRAPTVAVAYLHERTGMTLDAARDFIKQRHPCVPYMRMLESYYAGRTSDSKQ